jgi:hypothetical protein
LFIFLKKKKKKKKKKKPDCSKDKRRRENKKNYEFFLPLSLGSTASHPQVLHMCRKLNDEKG